MNKKKQKNFFHLGRAGFAATGPKEQKFFAPLFSKKRLPSCFQLNLSGSNPPLCVGHDRFTWPLTVNSVVAISVAGAPAEQALSPDVEGELPDLRRQFLQAEGGASLQPTYGIA